MSDSYENYCKLDSKIAIAYAGKLQEGQPKKNEKLTGYILNYYGKLYYRAELNEDWIEQSTPKVYLFRDLYDQQTYKVDSCTYPIKPHCPKGRILDCSERKLYEIQCGQWVPICNLTDTTNLSTVQTFLLDCNQSEALINLLPNLSEVKYLPELSSASDFESVMIIPNQIVATLKANTPQIGASSILTYQAQLSPEENGFYRKPKCPKPKTQTVLVSVIIQRVCEVRVSVTKGQFQNPNDPAPRIRPEQDAIITIANEDDCLSRFLPPPDNRSLRFINNWQLNQGRYVLPSGTFNLETGIYTVPCTADYDIDIKLDYSIPDNFPVDLTYIPAYLLMYRPAENMEPDPWVPVAIDSINGTAVNPQFFNILRSGTSVINTSLSLNAGDQLSVQYLDDAVGVTVNGIQLRLGNLGTNFTIHCLGSKTGDAPTVPVIPPPPQA